MKEKPKVTLLLLGAESDTRALTEALRRLAPIKEADQVIQAPISAIPDEIKKNLVSGGPAEPMSTFPTVDAPTFKPEIGGRCYEAPGHQRHKKGKRR